MLPLEIFSLFCALNWLFIVVKVDGKNGVRRNKKKCTKRSEMNSENKRFSISPTRGEKKKT